MTVLGFVATFIGFMALTAFAVWGIRSCHRRADAIRARWRAVAARLGGRYQPPSGPWYRRRSTSVEAEIDGIPVRLDNYAVSTGQATQVFTRASARGPAERCFRSSRRGAPCALGRLVGARDVPLGKGRVSAVIPGWCRDEDRLVRLMTLAGAASKSLTPA